MRKTIYRVTTGLVALIFAATGVGNLIPIEHIAHDLALLGYPPYFHTVLGFWKVLGAVAIVLPATPRLKEWAYAGMIFDLTTAIFSRVASDDTGISIIVPAAIIGLVVTSWRLRS